MLYASVFSIVLGILCLGLGLSSWGGISFELARILFFCSLGMAIAFFVFTLLPGERNRNGTILPKL